MKKIIIFFTILLSYMSIFSLDVDFKMIPQDTNKGHVYKIAFSSDGSIFASVNMSADTVKIWSIKGKLITLLKSDSQINICEISISRDNKYLALSDYSKITIWNIETKQKTVIKNNEDGMPYRNFSSLVFSDDGKSILAGVKLNITMPIPFLIEKNTFENVFLKSFDKKNTVLFKNAYFLNKKSFYELRLDLSSYTEIMNEYFMSGKKAEVRTSPLFKNRIERWSVDGKFLEAFAEHNSDMMTEIKYLFEDKNGQIFSFGTDSVIKIWDKSGELVNSISSDNPYYISNIDFSDDGKLIALAGSAGYKIIDTNGIILASNKKTFITPDVKIDKKFYIEAGAKGTSENYQFLLRVRDFSDKIIIESETLPNVVSSKISPDAAHAVIGSFDGSIKIVNLRNGKVVTLINNNEAEWLSYTDDGYWDASIHGEKLIAMVKDMKAYSPDQFAVKYNRPDIILERLGFRNEAELNYYKNLYLARLRKFGLKEESLTAELHVPSAKIIKSEISGKFINLSAEFTDSKYDLKKYNIYVNETPLYKSGKEINGRSALISEKIELTAGSNKIEVTCMNEKGSESFRTATFANCNIENIKGSLYFIGFGVSSYKNPELNLKYAAKDAVDLENIFKKHESNYDRVITKIYTNEEATLENIKNAKSILKDAKVDDTLILFISGHGIHDSDPAASYYYLTYNADLKNLKSSACAFEIVEDILHDIKPRKKLFFMDTCESGELDPETEKILFAAAALSGSRARSVRGLKKVESKTVMPARDFIFEKDRFIFNDLSRRSGAIVFSSSKGSELSYEADEYENGLFTEELINAISGSDADKDKDGFISVEELKNYVSRRVAEKSAELQHPTVDRDNKFQKIKIPLSR